MCVSDTNLHEYSQYIYETSSFSTINTSFHALHSLKKFVNYLGT